MFLQMLVEVEAVDEGVGGHDEQEGPEDKLGEGGRVVPGAVQPQADTVQDQAQQQDQRDGLQPIPLCRETWLFVFVVLLGDRRGSMLRPYS